MEKIEIPDWLKYKKGTQEKSPVYFLDLRGKDLNLQDKEVQKKVNATLKEMLKTCLPGKLEGPALIKTHVGERKSKTFIPSAFVRGAVEFLKEKGIHNIVSGDTTVVYHGERGGKENPPGNVSSYKKVIAHNCWDEKNSGIPFVILDRPETAVPGFNFSQEEIKKVVDSPGYYREFHLSAGFARAKTIINYAHLTLHGLAKLALAVKGLVMGGASRRGKLQMHAYLIAHLNEALCNKCGRCSAHCPEKALSWKKEECPELREEKCIGCGQCITVCAQNAITLQERKISDWRKAKFSFPWRLADYLMGMMNKKWEGLINVGHLYWITAQCDCVNQTQEPIVSDIGILVSRNPFSLDYLATNLFNEQAKKENRTDYPQEEHLPAFEEIKKTFGVITRPQVIKV